MTRRLVLATLAALALVAVTGCVGGTGPTEAQLTENASYDWETEADATYEVERGGVFDSDSVTAVYEIEGGEGIEFYRRGITRNRPVSVRAVQFRYENGTVADLGRESVTRHSERTEVTPPAESGQLALTMDTRSRSLEVHTTYNGSAEVVLPPGYRVGDFLLSDVRPGGYETEVVDDTEHVRWNEVEDDQLLLVRYYLERDWYVFYGLSAGLLVVGLLGYLYYSRLIERLVQWRKEQGLDVDEDDYDRRDPPPGMR